MQTEDWRLHHILYRPNTIKRGKQKDEIREYLKSIKRCPTVKTRQELFNDGNYAKLQEEETLRLAGKIKVEL